MANSPVLATRVTPELHRAVLDRAATNGTSLTETLRELLEAGLSNNQTQGRATPHTTP